MYESHVSDNIERYRVIFIHLFDIESPGMKISIAAVGEEQLLAQRQ